MSAAESPVGEKEPSMASSREAEGEGGETGVASSHQGQDTLEADATLPSFGGRGFRPADEEPE